MASHGSSQDEPVHDRYQRQVSAVSSFSYQLSLQPAAKAKQADA